MERINLTWEIESRGSTTKIDMGTNIRCQLTSPAHKDRRQARKQDSMEKTFLEDYLVAHIGSSPPSSGYRTRLITV